jgi:hypothetical protein
MFQITAKEVQTTYLKVVESSYFNSSDKVFCSDTEVLDLKHFKTPTVLSSD